MSPHVLMFQMFSMGYTHTAAGVMPHTLISACQIHTHTSASPQFWPTKFSELIVRTCDCVHGLYFGLWDALNVIDCELHPTEFSLIYSGGLVMYSSERSVQFSSKIYCVDRARNLYIFHCFIRHRVIFLCCAIVHMYLCTECVYWYETHSYCYLCIAKFIYSSIECKPIYEASSCSWPMEFTYDLQVYETVRL